MRRWAEANFASWLPPPKSASKSARRGVVLRQGGDVQLAHFEIGELAGRGFSAFDNGDVGVPVIPLDGAEDLLHRPFWPFQILPETPVIVDQQAADFASEVADAGDDQQRADFFGAHEAGGVTSVEETEKFLVVAAGAERSCSYAKVVSALGA